MKNFPFFVAFSLCLMACKQPASPPSKALIDQLHLKSGEIISCGPAASAFGIVNFDLNCATNVKSEFNTAMELLHSFEYDEAEKVFAKILNQSPACAMAYWGIAMCNFHPLWEPPTEADLTKGAKAIEIARQLTGKSERESAYLTSIAAYYTNWKRTEPLQRARNFASAMRELHSTYPDDPEAAIFYALALDASADPGDKSYLNQKKAGNILTALYKAQPDHPGIIHYIIHTYDYPGLATLGLDAARKYAAVAPSSAHALHMPSHIFTRLGLWNESIRLNLRSVEAAKCYATAAGIKGHWDEELHGLDYLVYAYLQKGDNFSAEKQEAYLETITQVSPVNFKEAYTFAAVPSRMALENKRWQQAAMLKIAPVNFPWNRFPWQEAIIHFARLLGAVHTGSLLFAAEELSRLEVLYDTLKFRKDLYKSGQVAIQIKTGTAWISFAEHKKAEALTIMKSAAAMEDSTSKHPVTPGEVLPAEELYGDMLLELKQNENAMLAYQTVLKKSPNRFNSLYGAATAARQMGKLAMASEYFKQLVLVSEPASDRPELKIAKAFLKQQQAN